VGDPRALSHAVQSGDRRHRWGSLLRRLREGLPA
jgi:hypothetical protein